MTTKAYKIQAAKIAGLAIRMVEGRGFFYAPDDETKRWDTFDWVVAYYQHYKVLPTV